LRISYDRDEDILIIELSVQGKIDYAEKVNSTIIHFTEDGSPILIEILDASDFISSVIKTTMKTKETALIAV
jgi:uncharacterized protein YuzE